MQFAVRNCFFVMIVGVETLVVALSGLNYRLETSKFIIDTSDTSDTNQIGERFT